MKINPKNQIPNPKQPPMFKIQNHGLLEFVSCKLFGVWKLGFGDSEK